LASGSDDQTVRLWNVQTRRELMQLDSGGIELGEVSSLSFSPDGKQLLVGARGRTAFWSAAPLVSDAPGPTVGALRQLLEANLDFRGRIRRLSENRRLPETLAKLDTNDVRVRAALAATEANWHASRQQWAEAALAFDRLAAADPTAPDGWLRTPGLLRVATALLHQDRPHDAAALLRGATKCRALDGLPPAVEHVDAVPGGLLHPLWAAVNERLAKKPRHPGLLELRAELAGQWSDAKAQVADFSAAIDALAQQKTETVAAALQRLHDRRGNAYVRLKKWQEAIDDFTQAVGSATTDVELLTNQARAEAGMARQLAFGGQVAFAKSTLAKSRAKYERLLEADPRSDLLAAELADLLLIDGTVPSDRERLRVFAMKLADPWAKLAGAYYVVGNQRASDELMKSHPWVAGTIPSLHAIARDWEGTIAAFHKLLADEPANPILLTKLITAYQSAGRARESIPYWVKLSAANPKNTYLWIDIAARQAWFGEAQELAATRRRILALAKDTSDGLAAERAAKVCFLHPPTDKAELEEGLALAQKAVAIGKSGEWGLLTLGIAEYRSGQAAAAAETLLAAIKAGPHNRIATDTAAFYRAMSLYRSGKSDEARSVAIEAAARMKPLPTPSLDSPYNRDDLVLWLAYKEANAMIKFE
jgi:tetratricopeptide (TPR) repeat protein